MSTTPFIGPYAPVPWSQFESEVLALYAEPHRRPGTLAKMRQVLREVGAVCPTTDQLGPVTIASWLSAHPGRAAWTRRTLLSALRAACSYADWKGYAPNPFGFRGLSQWIPADELEEAESCRRHRTATEIRKVIEQADRECAGGDWHALRLRAAVYVWAYTGAGALEVLGLRVTDVDLAGGTIAIRSHPGRRLKTGPGRRCCRSPSRWGACWRRGCRCVAPNGYSPARPGGITGTGDRPATGPSIGSGSSGNGRGWRDSRS